MHYSFNTYQASTFWYKLRCLHEWRTLQNLRMRIHIYLSRNHSRYRLFARFLQFSSNEYFVEYIVGLQVSIEVMKRWSLLIVTGINPQKRGRILRSIYEGRSSLPSLTFNSKYLSQLPDFKSFMIESILRPVHRKDLNTDLVKVENQIQLTNLPAKEFDEKTIPYRRLHRLQFRLADRRKEENNLCLTLPKYRSRISTKWWMISSVSSSLSSASMHMQKYRLAYLYT